MLSMTSAFNGTGEVGNHLKPLAATEHTSYIATCIPVQKCFGGVVSGPLIHYSIKASKQRGNSETILDSHKIITGSGRGQ